jgi:hypothetical protein
MGFVSIVAEGGVLKLERERRKDARMVRQG